MPRPTVKILTGLACCLLGGFLVFSGSLTVAKSHLSQYLLEKSWRETSHSSSNKPWPGADTFPVAKISVARLNYSAIVLHGVSGEALAFGPGHLPTSTLPGLRGNSVIAGHRDSHFRVLRKLQFGDLVEIERADMQTVTYKIHELKVVDEYDTSILQSGDKTELTLITCYPFNTVNPGGSLRYVVSAHSI